MLPQMLVRRQVARGLQRKFSSNICIMAGYPSMDIHGARIMEALNNKASGQIEFWGIGGPQMKRAGLADNLADVNKLPDKPLYVFNNAHPWHRERIYAIYMIATRYRNWKVIKQMEKTLQDKIFERDPAAVLTLGNEYFMKRLYCAIEKKYEDYTFKHNSKPAMLHYDRLMYGQSAEHSHYLDHYFYTVPYRPANWQYYTFPSTFAGSQGLFDAYSYLMKQSDKHRGLAADGGIYLNEKYHSILMEELILNSRSKFRAANRIPDDATVFFASPGSDAKEVKWTIPIISKAVDQFLTKYSKVGAENFAVIISLPEGRLSLQRT